MYQVLRVCQDSDEEQERVKKLKAGTSPARHHLGTAIEATKTAWKFECPQLGTPQKLQQQRKLK
jgi:hypothetical protein